MLRQLTRGLGGGSSDNMDSTYRSGGSRTIVMWMRQWTVLSIGAYTCEKEAHLVHGIEQTRAHTCEKEANLSVWSHTGVSTSLLTLFMDGVYLIKHLKCV
jgi:hypothetical protein